MNPFCQPDMFYSPYWPGPFVNPYFMPFAPQPNSILLYSQLQKAHIDHLPQIDQSKETIAQRREQEVVEAEAPSQVQPEEVKVKRRYRKRRLWLQKRFRCNVKNCKKKYSSKIALNSHKRKKHPKGQREQP